MGWIRRGALPGLALLAALGCSEDRLGGAECQTNRDCTGGAVCIAGACVKQGGADPRCRNNDDCKADEFCDVTTQACKKVLPLDASVPRPDANLEVDAGETAMDATAAPDAAVGPADVGVPPVCQMDRDCGAQPQWICLVNQCLLGCGQPGGLICTGGTVCDMPTGHCRSPMSQCNGDGDCMPGPPSQICVNQTCVFGCGVDSTRCRAGTEVCDTNTGRCVPLGNRCAMDSECGPPARVCEGMQCVPGCGAPGGIQCSGQNPICNAMTGRCGPVPPCTLDGDCGPNQICVNRVCRGRCDRGGPACVAPEVCNPADGRCAMGNAALGARCSFDAQCQSGLCVGVTRNMMTEQFCTVPCGASSNCPLDSTCEEISGMRFCITESFFTPPATFDTRAGGACMTGNITCQSGWCNTGTSQCIETCSRNSDCMRFGGNCWTYTQAVMGGTNYDHLCVSRMGRTTGQTCAVNADCQSGICNRYTNTCGVQCCADRDCAAAENCLIYDLDPQQGDIVKLCQPRGTPVGPRALGASCTMPSECETGICAPLVPTSSTSARKCSSFCCTEMDCASLPSGGRCRPFGGPTINMISTIVGVCVPN